MRRARPLSSVRTAFLVANATKGAATRLSLPFFVSILHDTLGTLDLCGGTAGPHVCLPAGKAFHSCSAFPILECLVPSRRIRILRASDTQDPPRASIVGGSPVSTHLAGATKASPRVTSSGQQPPWSNAFPTSGANTTIGRTRSAPGQKGPRPLSGEVCR